MKDLRYPVAAVVLGLVAMANADAVRTVPTGVYNTGVSNSGTPLASGAIDPHYTLVSSPNGGGPAFVVIDGQFPLWAVVLHVNREVIHHGAEVAVLRDLYRAGAASD